MQYYKIKPQVPGGFGPKTVFEECDGRRRLQYAQIILQSWPDHLFKNVMFYAISDELRVLMEANGISGVTFAQCSVVKGDQFEIANPGMNDSLPKFFQLIPTGIARIDDIGKEGAALIVSERVKSLCDQLKLSDVIWDMA